MRFSPVKSLGRRNFHVKYCEIKTYCCGTDWLEGWRVVFLVAKHDIYFSRWEGIGTRGTEL